MTRDNESRNFNPSNFSQSKTNYRHNRNFYFESNHERMVERGGLCASQTLIRVPSTTRHRYLGRPGGHSFTVYNEAVQLQRQCEGGSIGRFKGHRTIKRMAGQPRFLESSSTKWTMSLCGIGGRQVSRYSKSISRAGTKASIFIRVGER